VRESARRLVASLDAVEAKAKPIVASYRALRVNGSLSPQVRAAAHVQLGPLQAEREALVAAEISNLNATLGPNLAGRLRTFIETMQSNGPAPATPRLETKAPQGSTLK